jgi:hypothetical protein
MSDDCASLFSAEHPDDIKGKAIPQLMMVHSIWIWKLGGGFSTRAETGPDDARHDRYGVP